MQRSFLVFSVLTLACISCTSGEAEVPGGSTSQVEVAARIVQNTAWDTLFEVQSGLNDTLLAKPRKIVAVGEHLYVGDMGSQEIIAFDTAGKFQWRFGGIGGGPLEFQNIVDIEADESGNLWVSDGGLSRITIVTSEGTKKRSFPTRVVSRHVVIFDGSVATTVVSKDEFFVTLDSSGKVGDRFPIPIKEYRNTSPVFFQMYTAKDPGGRLWALASPFAAKFFVYDGLSKQPVCTNNQVEVPDEILPLPQGKMPKVWMYSMSMSDGLLYMLARGNTVKVRETVDVYNLYNCRYVHSYVFPRQVIALAVQNETFFVTYEDSTTGPGILALKRVR